MRFPLLLGVTFTLLVSPRFANSAEPRFSPHPRLAISADEANQLRAAPDFAAKRDQAMKQGDALLAKPVEVPRGPGQWIFYYACSKDGSTLKALSDTEHRCPKCDATYSDQRTVEAYRTQLHDQVNAAALKLAWAYWYSGEARFAMETRRLLLRLADDYPNYPVRRDRWGRSGVFATIGGRRYIQSLDEAVAILPLAKAYDLTRDAPLWSDEQRHHVEEHLFREVARTLTWWNQGKNNHQTWYNAGLLAIGSVLGDAPLVSRAIDGSGGFHDQLKRSVGDDGLWYEGAMAYHNYALQAMIEIVEAARRLEVPLHKEARFQAMITGPLDYVYPNGQFPAINDSDYSTIHSFDSHFAWGWRMYREPRFAQAYARGDEKKLRQLPGAAEMKVESWTPRSKNLANTGLAVLRRGVGDDAVCAMLDYGQHGDGHGHFDKLNLLLFADHREWLLDPGRLTYSHAEYKTWVKETVAHNTVTIDGRTQAATTGELVAFQEAADYVACVAQSTGAYQGVKLKRWLLLANDFLVDRFDIETTADRLAPRIDWHAHAQCKSLLPPENISPSAATTPLGDSHGYQHLRDAKRYQLSGPTRWRFTDAPNQTLGVWLANTGEQELFQSVGIGYHIQQPAPCLTRRVTASRTTFWTVYELFPHRRPLVRVEQSATAPNEIRVQAQTGEWRVVSDEASIKRAAS